jgi:hypothetical protein
MESESQLVRVVKDNKGNWQVPKVRPREATTDAAAKSGDDGTKLSDGEYTGSQDEKTGIFALEKANLFNLLCIPPDDRALDTSPAVYQAAMAYCAARRAMLIVDSPATWSANKETAATKARDHLGNLGTVRGSC